MIWVIGKSGMLGSELCRQLEARKYNWVGTGHEVDIRDIDALEGFTESVETNAYFPSRIAHKDRKITWIINCSGYTNVEKAEEKSELCARLNEEGPRNIARTARKIGAKLIHISTDYVFSGKGAEPYTEDAEKKPLGVYGRTKLAGEVAVQKEMNTYYIVRTAWLYGFDGRNFVYTMTRLMNERERLRVVSDQRGTPTCAPDLAECLIRLIEKSEGAKSLIGKRSAPAYGIYHFTNLGEASWQEFAEEIYRLGRKYGRIKGDCRLEGCSTAEYGAKVERPAYSVLSKNKIIKELKLKIPEWQTSLEKFIKSDRFNPL